VTSLGSGDSFTYDDNGNMIQRVQGSVTWTHTFDAENRLVTVSGEAYSTEVAEVRIAAGAGGDRRGADGRRLLRRAARRGGLGHHHPDPHPSNLRFAPSPIGLAGRHFQAEGLAAWFLSEDCRWIAPGWCPGAVLNSQNTGEVCV
jgi:hypothetical protein